MSRYARKKSNSKVYHVMLRGIDRMPIFIDNYDKIKFLETMDRMKKLGEYEVYAYCLMNNHVHLLIKEGKDTIQRSLKRIGVSYVYYFNNKYARVGHLFQDRFRSETIEDDSYLLAAIRYIHNNPVKAGIVKRAVDYFWSSYHEYIKSEKDSNRVNTEAILGMFSDNKVEAIRMFMEFTHEDKTTEEFIDLDNKVEQPENPVSDALCFIEELQKNYGYSLSEIRNFQDRKKRNEVLRQIKKKSGMSVRELSGILGISKDIIFRA